MAFTVRQFCLQMYRLISASNPTLALHGDDESLALRVLNQILQSYASTGLMISIANSFEAPITPNIREILFVDKNYPTTTTVSEVITLTNLNSFFPVVDGTRYAINDLVSGNGIPAGSYITEIVGNLVTINQLATYSGQSNVTFIQPILTPGTLIMPIGRLANLDNAWLESNGVTYPLIDKSRDQYLAAWKYQPQRGLPRFIITFPETAGTRVVLYPAPSQFYTFHIRGKFQLSTLSANDDMSLVPEYYHLYLLYAVAKYVSKFKGRAGAWTPDLEMEYQELKDQIVAASEVNLSITGDEQSLLSGAWRVRSGI